MVQILQTAGAYAGQYLSEDRNLLLNGEMFIDQVNEAASVSLVSGTASYVTDGFGVKFSTTNSATVSAQQVTDAPAGLAKSLKITTGTGATVAAADYIIIESPVEGFDCRQLNFGGANAQPLSLQFWVKSSIAGTFSYCLQNASNARTYVNKFTIPSTGTWYQIAVNNIPGDITGTWLTTNAVGLYLVVTIASGSTNQTSTLGAWQASSAFANSSQNTAILSTSSATFQLSGVQLEPGIVCTQLPNIKYPYLLNKCQRQYQKTFAMGTAVAQNAGAAGCVTVRNSIALSAPSTWWQLSPTMRATPTIVTYNPSASNANWRDLSTSSDSTVLVDQAGTKGPNGVLIGTSSTVATISDVLAIHATADARLTLF